MSDLHLRHTLGSTLLKVQKSAFWYNTTAVKFLTLATDNGGVGHSKREYGHLAPIAHREYTWFHEDDTKLKISENLCLGKYTVSYLLNMEL